MAEDTTIQISHETKARLKEYGKMGDTYDMALNRIMDRLQALENKEKGSNPCEATA